MRYPAVVVWAAAAAVILNISASAEDLKVAETDFSAAPSVQMRVAGEAEGSPSIIGGTPADAATWPATLIFRGPTKDCTSTVVGERVVLTAAHCVENRSTATIELNGKSIRLFCIQHPDYVEDYRLDIALCAGKSAIELSDGAPYEKISTDSKTPVLQQNITLLGYGCTIRGSDEFGALYRGPATIKKRSGAYISALGTAKAGKAAVCFGDSGGAAYMEPTEHRRLIFGVASRGDIIARTSLTYLGEGSVASFVREFAQVNAFRICGLDADASPCHN